MSKHELAHASRFRLSPQQNHNAVTGHSDRSPPVCDNRQFGDVLTSQELLLRQQLLDQADEAFAKTPSLSGVIHGRRTIQLGKRWGGRAGYFPSKKNATGGLPAVFLPVESRAESVYALELERNPAVRAFRTQAIELVLPGSTFPVFPDFLISDAAGKMHLREVKADKRYLSLKARQRIERLTIVLRRWGFSYAVIDTTEMPRGMKSANLFWLHKQFGSVPHQEHLDEFLALDFQSGTYGQLRCRCKEVGLDESVVPYLLFTERLNTNWDRCLDDDSGVWK